jgi:hypothetical protein
MEGRGCTPSHSRRGWDQCEVHKAVPSPASSPFLSRGSREGITQDHMVSTCCATKEGLSGLLCPPGEVCGAGHSSGCLPLLVAAPRTLGVTFLLLCAFLGQLQPSLAPLVLLKVTVRYTAAWLPSDQQGDLWQVTCKLWVRPTALGGLHSGRGPLWISGVFPPCA